MQVIFPQTPTAQDNDHPVGIDFSTFEIVMKQRTSRVNPSEELRQIFCAFDENCTFI